jgi:hypothetical protein
MTTTMNSAVGMVCGREVGDDQKKTEADRYRGVAQKLHLEHLEAEHDRQQRDCGIASKSWAIRKHDAAGTQCRKRDQQPFSGQSGAAPG